MTWMTPTTSILAQFMGLLTTAYFLDRWSFTKVRIKGFWPCFTTSLVILFLYLVSRVLLGPWISQFPESYHRYIGIIIFFGIDPLLCFLGLWVNPAVKMRWSRSLIFVPFVSLVVWRFTAMLWAAAFILIVLLLAGLATSGRTGDVF